MTSSPNRARTVRALAPALLAVALALPAWAQEDVGAPTLILPQELAPPPEPGAETGTEPAMTDLRRMTA